MRDLLEMPQFRPVAPSKRYIETMHRKAKLLKFYTKEDQELSIECRTVSGTMRVDCLESTDDATVVVHGLDENDNETFHCASSFALELTMKIVKSKPEGSKMKIGFLVVGKEIGG